LNQEIANSGSGVSLESIVTRIKVVNGGTLVLLPARVRGFSILKTMQILYGDQKAYYSMGAGDKAAGA
jgi:hypothetical protein